MDLGISRRKFVKTGGLGSLALTSGLIKPQSLLADEVLKIGVVLVSPVTEVGWTKQHSLAAAAAKDAFAGRVEVDIIDNIFQPQDAERVFRGFATTGHKLIFGTSFSHGAPIARVAQQFPKVIFDNCAGVKTAANLGSFEAKYYEAGYLAGIIAGKMTKTGTLGFLGGFPIPDIVGPGNAILLGAQSVRPETTCKVLFMNSWSDPGKEKEGARALIAQGCDVICAMTDSPAAVQAAEEAGVWAIGYASDMRRFAPTRQLTSMIVDWSSIYIQDAKDVMANSWAPQARWHGTKEGVVKLAPIPEIVPADVRALVAKKAEDIKQGTLQPYAGEIKDQSGAVRVAKGKVMNEEEVRAMNWLVAGMVGQAKG
jgi:simple sugar transport system substrate-binding protein